MTPRPPVTAFLGLGGNVGDAVETLASAVYALHDSDGIAVEDVSGIYETPPWGPVEQAPFANCVVRIRTTLDPRELLLECQTTEAAYGRDREAEERWGPRPLDIDLLLYGDETVDTPELTIPHPRLAERAFALVPLLEVFPGGTLPDGRRLTRLLLDLGPIEDMDLIVRLEEVPGQHVARPEIHGGGGAYLAEEWHARGRPDPPPPD
ncbi:MAG: 2-amino-4-hydroxy-6-hydroxymethyldihydropteridine diphosphokinase [Actinobacteria bacterium]|nr:2-amino-4-hydroxy-6-hydroxymethyldihydropteridine diphosphokinase [Actinomycetota bacterium]